MVPPADQVFLSMDMIFAMLSFVTSMLLAILAWAGLRVQRQVDGIPEALDKMRVSVESLGKALSEDLQHHEVRINTLEIRMNLYHPHDRRAGDLSEAQM